MNTDILLEQFRQIHGDRYDYSKTEYVNSRTKIKIICKEHGEFFQKPANHKSGQGCPKCKHDNQKMNRSGFIKKATAKHNGKYDYSEVEFVDKTTKTTIICPEHGEFQQTPVLHLSGSGCPKCGVQRKPQYTEKQLLQKFNEVHSNKYSYIINSLYINDAVKVICPHHGEFSQKIKSHLEGHGCKYCSHNLKSINDRIQQFIEIHGDKYDYSKVDSNKHNDKISIICREHGEFQQYVGNHLKGHGCFKCNVIGGRNLLKSDEFIQRSTNIHDSKYDYSLVKYIDYYFKVKIICPYHGVFEQSPSNHLAGNACPRCALESSSSKAEDEIFNFISSYYKKDIIRNDREVIKPYELDIYIPDLDFAIEYHGNYYHSYNNNELKVQRFKHYDKHDNCVKNGITLFQIFEYEYHRNPNIINSMIMNKTLKTNSVYARKCDIVETTQEKTATFLNHSHIQGHRPASVNLALISKNNIIDNQHPLIDPIMFSDILCIMTISRHPKYEWEIIRFANRPGFRVVGGASKLFKHFANVYKPSKVLSYCDRRFSNGNLYKKLDFALLGVTKPGYKYYKSMNVLSRTKCRKNNLHNILINFDPSISESQNMFNNGYRRLWDAGHYKFLWSK